MAYLSCECGEELFVKAVKVKTTMGGGVVDEVAGWRCFSCKKKAESGEMMRRLELAEKEKEVQRLQQEIDDGKKARQAQGQQKQGKSDRPETRPSDIPA